MKGDATEMPAIQEAEEIESLVGHAYQDVKEILVAASPDGVLADTVIEEVLSKRPTVTESIVREAIWRGLNKDWVLRSDRHLDIAA
jgi:predicted transcriptional regulator